MRNLFTILFSLVICLGVHAQTEIKGLVVDTASGSPIATALITLLRHGNLIKFTHSDTNGKFNIAIGNIQRNDSLSVTCLGYAKKKVSIHSTGQITIKLNHEDFELNEVQVRGNRVIGRADTISYDLTRFVNARDNSLKDVLRKLPGVEVGDDGTIQVNGKSISRFTVEGLDMTGGRYNQLEENIKAKDVKRAEVINHDQPIKALRDKVFTDDVAMNIVIKDSVRDKILVTLKPYLLVGETKSIGGEANAMQIGKKRQLSYDVAYDRTGKDLSAQTDVQSTWRSGLDGASIPSWINRPLLVAPIDAERLRFNTSQKYAVNRIQKKGGNELRLSTHYLRAVERQKTENESLYNLGGNAPTATSQQQSLLMKNDDFGLELEQRKNAETSYGSKSLRISAHQSDGLSSIGNTLTQRVKIPNVIIVGNLYQLFTIGKNQLTVKAVADYSHQKDNLHVNDSLTSLSTNLWHAAASVGWMRSHTYFTHSLTAFVDAQNMNVKDNTPQLGVTLTPYWQYQRNPWLISLSVHSRIERFPHQGETFFLWGGSAYARWKGQRRSEWNLSVNYDEATGNEEYFALKTIRRNYRTYFNTDGTIPKERKLYTSFQYLYKRPLIELFFNFEINAGRTWSNMSNGLTIDNGIYNLFLTHRPSQSTYSQAEGSITKGFFALHLKTRLAGNITYNKGQQLTAGDLINFETINYLLSANIEFSPSWCAVSYNGDFQWQRSSGFSTLFNWKQVLSITSTIKQMDFNLSLIHYHNELQYGRTMNNLIGDAKVIWRTRKIRTILTISNIFNKREYSISQYSNISTITDHYYLRGRELLATLQISL